MPQIDIARLTTSTTSLDAESCRLFIAIGELHRAGGVVVVADLVVPPRHGAHELRHLEMQRRQLGEPGRGRRRHDRGSASARRNCRARSTAAVAIPEPRRAPQDVGDRQHRAARDLGERNRKDQVVGAFGFQAEARAAGAAEPECVALARRLEHQPRRPAHHEA